MGAKTWMLVFTDSEVPLLLSNYGAFDRSKSEQLAIRAFPKHKLEPLDDLTFYDMCPPDEKVSVGCYENVSLVVAGEFGLDRPSILDPKYVNLMKSKRTYLFAMHSVVDFFAFGVWEKGELRRSFGASADDGIMEDIGNGFEFELPYWNGQHPVSDEDDEPDSSYLLPFHPLEFGEDVLLNLIGFCFEGQNPRDGLDPEDFTLLSFSRKPKWRLFA